MGTKVVNIEQRLSWWTDFSRLDAAIIPDKRNLNVRLNMVSALSSYPPVAKVVKTTHWSRPSVQDICIADSVTSDSPGSVGGWFPGDNYPVASVVERLDQSHVPGWIWLYIWNHENHLNTSSGSQSLEEEKGFILWFSFFTTCRAFFFLRSLPDFPRPSRARLYLKLFLPTPEIIIGYHYFSHCIQFCPFFKGLRNSSSYMHYIWFDLYTNVPSVSVLGVRSLGRRTSSGTQGWGRSADESER